MKLGIQEDSTNRTKIAELLRFSTSESGDERINLKEYVDRMKQGETGVCYITGESIAVVSSSPVLENLCKKGLEELDMVDPVDEYAVQQPEGSVGRSWNPQRRSIRLGMTKMRRKSLRS